LGIAVSAFTLYILSQKNIFYLNNMVISYIVVVIFNIIIIIFSSFEIIMLHNFSFNNSGPSLLLIIPIVLIYGCSAAYHIYLIINIKNYLNANMNNPNNKMIITSNIAVQYINNGNTSTAFTVTPLSNKSQVVIVQSSANIANTNENLNPNSNPQQVDDKANLPKKFQFQIQQDSGIPMQQGYAVPPGQPPMQQGYAVPPGQPPMQQGYEVPQGQLPLQQGYGVPQFQQLMQQGNYASQFQPNVQGQYSVYLTNGNPNPSMEYNLPPYTTYNNNPDIPSNGMM